AVTSLRCYRVAVSDQDGRGTNRLSKAELILGTGMSQNLSRGRRLAYPFEVLILADMAPPTGEPWYTRTTTGASYIRQPSQPRYLCQQGPDFHIKLRLAEGTLQPRTLSLNGCGEGKEWVDVDTATANFTVNSKGRRGIPDRICPKMP
ncbi:MAG: hypothetical protein RPU72_12225, partial [Candidatus Sedimenticola sp. (ex Thyasira tokunagai)]